MIVGFEFSFRSVRAWDAGLLGLMFAFMIDCFVCSHWCTPISRLQVNTWWQPRSHNGSKYDASPRNMHKRCWKLCILQTIDPAINWFDQFVHKWGEILSVFFSHISTIVLQFYKISRNRRCCRALRTCYKKCIAAFDFMILMTFVLMIITQYILCKYLCKYKKTFLVVH